MTVGRWANDLVERISGRRLMRDPAEVIISAVDAMTVLVTSGQIPLAEAKALGELVRGCDPDRPIIEIGTLYGWSTLVMSLCKPADQELVTVDNYSWNPLGLSPDEHFDLAQHRLADAVARHHVTQVRMNKDEFYASYTGARPTLFFCDADHTYEGTRADLAWARDVGADVICGDDYKPGRWPGVVRAVTEFGGPSRVVGRLFVL